MMKKLKSSIKNLFSRWKDESKLIKQCDKLTPLHCKVYNLCTFVLIVLIFFRILFSFPSSADEGVTPRAVPSDLTGYTVTVPEWWSFLDYSTSTVSFDINGSVTSVQGSPGNVSFSSFVIDGDDDVNCRFLPSNIVLTTDMTFSFSVTGGTDVSNSSLIQWLVDNDAVFTGGSSPEPNTFSIAGGIYHFKQFGDLPDIPDAGWSDGQGYTYSYTLAGKYVTTSRTISFTGFNITFDEYVSSSHYTVTFSVDTNDGVIDLATYSASYGQIELETRSDLKYLVFDEALIGSYNDIEFIRQFLVSGLPDSDTSPTDNPWAYILEMIIEALKVDLFGYFSVWDIFTTICGIFIVTWLLKLLAGG